MTIINATYYCNKSEPNTIDPAMSPVVLFEPVHPRRDSSLMLMGPGLAEVKVGKIYVLTIEES